MKLRGNVFFLIGLIFALVGSIFTIVGIGIAVGFYLHGGTMVVNGVTEYYAPGTVGLGSVLFLATFGGIGLVFVLLGIMLIMTSIKRIKTIMKLKNDGIYVTAKISSVERNLSVKINKRHPYYVTCEYEDIYSGGIHVFRSDNILDNPGDVVGTDITVYVDKNNWNLYYVDTEALTSRYIYH